MARDSKKSSSMLHENKWLEENLVVLIHWKSTAWAELLLDLRKSLKISKGGGGETSP